MKIQVKIEGDLFVFSASERDLWTLVSAAATVVYGDSDFTYTVVDSLEIPVTAFQHHQSYSLLKQQSRPPKQSLLERVKAEGLLFAVRPSLLFEGETEVQRVGPAPAALKALAQSAGLSETWVFALFAGTECVRTEDYKVSRREVCVDLAGLLTWNFGDKCLGRTELSSVTVDKDFITTGFHSFRMLSPSCVPAWSALHQLDIPSYVYYLRSFEQSAIWSRWGSEFSMPIRHNS